MAWFKVDDGFSTSPKVLSIRRADRLAAVGLWTVAGTWCAKHLTDGAVPDFMLDEWGADMSHGTALVDARLWVRTDTGFVFHDWEQYQPMRRDVQAQREKERQRKEAWRQQKAEKAGESPENVPSVSQGDETVLRRSPDPTRPDPTRPIKEVSSTKRQSAARGTRLSPDWQPSLPLVDWTKKEAPGVNGYVEVQKFVNYWVAMPGQKGVKLDWDRTWKNWILRVKSDSPQLATAEPKKRFQAHAD